MEGVDRKRDLEDKREEDGMEKNHQEDQVDGGIKKEDGMCVSGFWDSTNIPVGWMCKVTKWAGRRMKLCQLAG